VTTARSPAKESCLVCEEHTGEVVLPGGQLLADDLHVPPLSGSSYLGHLLVTSRRHCPDFSDLDPGEAASVGVAISACSAALKVLGAGHVYVATVGHGVAHLHVHLLPRWPGTPDDVAWYAVVRSAPGRGDGDRLDRDLAATSS
jgi:diadenosine tetraphosphate (Ap4A) HIT family hydrolase